MAEVWRVRVDSGDAATGTLTPVAANALALSPTRVRGVSPPSSGVLLAAACDDGWLRVFSMTDDFGAPPVLVTSIDVAALVVNEAGNGGKEGENGAGANGAGENGEGEEGEEGDDDDMECTAVAFDPVDGARLFVGCGSSVVGFNAADSEGVSSSIETFRVNSEEVSGVAVDARGQYLAIGDDGGEVQVVDLGTGEVRHTLRAGKKGHTSLCSCVSFYPRQKSTTRRVDLVSGGLDSCAILWDPLKGKALHKWNMVTTHVTGESRTQMCNPPFVHAVALLEVAHNKKQVDLHAAVGCGDGTARVLDVRSRSLLACVSAHASAVSAVAMRKGVLVTGGNDGKVRVWDLERLLQALPGATQEPLATADLGDDKVQDLVLLPADDAGSDSDALFVCVAGVSGSIRCVAFRGAIRL